MYVVLFYDERYQERNEYLLLDTDKEISELGDFTSDYISEYSQLTSPVRYGIMPTWNLWHRMASKFPYWYVDHNFIEKSIIINFTFYQPTLVDDGGNTYYLALFQYCHKSIWNMALLKTTRNNVTELAKSKCEELYGFKVTNYDKQTNKLLYDKGEYARFIKFRLNPIVI